MHHSRVLRRQVAFGVLLLIWCLAGGMLHSQATLTPETLWKLGRVGAGVLSADGKTAVYSLTTFDLAEDRGSTDLYMIPMAGGEARRLTNDPAGESDFHWVTTPSGERLFFLAKKGEDLVPQIYSFNAEGKDLRRHSDLSSGIANLKVAPGGRYVAYSADVKLDPTVQDVYPDLPKADGRIIDGLMYRHWTEWHDYSWSHLFVAPINEAGEAGPGIDLMPGLRADCPVPPFGGAEQFSWSPDGQEIALTAKIVNNPAFSTDTDIYLVSIGNDRALRCITTGFDGYDMEPRYSPDGKWISFHSMERPGFEADKNRLFIYDRTKGELLDLTATHDINVHSSMWHPDSKSLYFKAESFGTEQIFHLVMEEAVLRQVTRGDWNHDLLAVSSDANVLLAKRQNILRPFELVSISPSDGTTRELTDANGAIFGGLSQPTFKARWTKASDGQMIHSWVIYPPGFDATRKYPMLLYCQGGPQSQVSQFFSYRWNFHLMAAKGFVVLAPNRRGLPGFGQDWNDQISADWGGQAMYDLLACTDDLFTEPYIDTKKAAAVGASFGGYSVYWLMGNHDRRFAAMISHCGCFNLESFYGATEEMWFADWDLGGPYWASDEARSLYESFSPHRFVQNWNTPLLVIHSEKDFRVPINQGMEAFTAAQVRGVPSRFLYFPGEGHWIMKPQNSVLWQRVFFEWLDRFCK